MRILIRSLVLACLWSSGCNQTSNTGGDAAVDAARRSDAAIADLAAPDFATGADLFSPPDLTSPADLVRPPDLTANGACVKNSDCRLFSSYCKAQPCMCIALRQSDPDPTCIGGMVNCFMDPCQGKTAVCDQVRGLCVVQ